MIEALQAHHPLIPVVQAQAAAGPLLLHRGALPVILQGQEVVPCLTALDLLQVVQATVGRLLHCPD